ncbi:hypothetical protein K239x_29650 [Planctomycetes bacterium K23_9]|uniref:Uncharacterized protein n=2 Tax=Stieleria marina TaxID=1930275 RepID=A0A517NV26_9BACT|nr:hypothetical protein K239x_29650 [Planctomycetes bacterium K23_9]
MSKRSLQFSLRSILIGVLIAAIVSLSARWYIERRADFVDPPTYAQSKPLTQAEIDELIAKSKKGRDVYASEISREHPPLGIDHWDQQADKLRPGMTKFALFKYVPAASANGSWLIPRPNGETTQVFYYAVDSEYAALCEMRTNDPSQSLRVVKMLGFYKHHQRFTDYGSPNITKLDITSGPEPVVVFE